MRGIWITFTGNHLCRADRLLDDSEGCPRYTSPLLKPGLCYCSTWFRILNLRQIPLSGECQKKKGNIEEWLWFMLRSSGIAQDPNQYMPVCMVHYFDQEQELAEWGSQHRAQKRIHNHRLARVIGELLFSKFTGSILMFHPPCSRCILRWIGVLLSWVSNGKCNWLWLALTMQMNFWKWVYTRMHPEVSLGIFIWVLNMIDSFGTPSVTMKSLADFRWANISEITWVVLVLAGICPSTVS